MEGSEFTVGPWTADGDGIWLASRALGFTVLSKAFRAKGLV